MSWEQLLVLKSSLLLYVLASGLQACGWFAWCLAQSGIHPALQCTSSATCAQTCGTGLLLQRVPAACISKGSLRWVFFSIWLRPPAAWSWPGTCCTSLSHCKSTGFCTCCWKGVEGGGSACVDGTLLGRV